MSMNQAQEAMAAHLAAGDSSWTAGGYTGALFDSATWAGVGPGGWTLGILLATFPSSELAVAGYARTVLTGLAQVDDDSTNYRTLLTSDPIDFGSPDAGGTYDTLVIFYDLGDDDLNWVAGFFDISDPGPGTRNTDGNPIVINPNADGWFSLQTNP
jgi:hypothetical protein